MNITGKRLNKIIKEELDIFLNQEGVEASDVTNLREPVPSDPDALANNIKIAEFFKIDQKNIETNKK